MKKKRSYVLLALGLVLMLLGICFSGVFRSIIWLGVMAAGLALICAGVEGLVPKFRCPVCGQSVRPPRYPKDGVPEGCFRCSKCEAFVPYR